MFFSANSTNVDHFHLFSFSIEAFSSAFEDAEHNKLRWGDFFGPCFGLQEMPTYKFLASLVLGFHNERPMNQLTIE